MTDSRQIFLGIDTSTVWRTVGLSDGGPFEVSSNWTASRGQGRDLLPKIEEFLGAHHLGLRDLAGIAVANGPGSFTALRVGAAVAQGLGMGLEIPVVPVGSLESYPYLLAETVRRATVILPARGGEVFVETYSRNSDQLWIREVVVECVSIESLVGKIPDPGIWVGPGLNFYEEAIGASSDGAESIGPKPTRVPCGGLIARLGRKRWQDRPDGYPPVALEINYHQSHGALTIAERKGEKNHV
jgi:tRNA threonylcarbamoyl adenosine modification protein YeaZ